MDDEVRRALENSPESFLEAFDQSTEVTVMKVKCIPSYQRGWASDYEAIEITLTKEIAPELLEIAMTHHDMMVSLPKYLTKCIEDGSKRKLDDIIQMLKALASQA